MSVEGLRTIIQARFCLISYPTQWVFSSPGKDMFTYIADNSARRSLDIRATTGLGPGILAVLQNDAAKHIFYWGNPGCTLIWLNQLFVGVICTEPSSILFVFRHVWCVSKSIQHMPLYVQLLHHNHVFQKRHQPPRSPKWNGGCSIMAHPHQSDTMAMPTATKCCCWTRENSGNMNGHQRVVELRLLMCTGTGTASNAIKVMPTYVQRRTL